MIPVSFVPPGQHMNESKLFDNLPEELQRLILELAFDAEESDRNAARLALVSRKVRDWVEPLIYRQIVLDQAGSPPLMRFHKFLWTVQHSSKSKHFFTQHVKFLHVEPFQVRFAGLLGFLSLCENVERLSCQWCYVGTSQQKEIKEMQALLLTKPYPYLRRLSIWASVLPLEDPHLFAAPIFRNLTHLDIRIIREPIPHIPWKDLQTLQHLIHIHFDMLHVTNMLHPGQFADVIQGLVEGMSEYGPPTLQYIALLFPWNFLFRVGSLPEGPIRQVYERLVKGSMDPRVVVGLETGAITSYKHDSDDDDNKDMVAFTSGVQVERVKALGRWTFSNRLGMTYRLFKTRNDQRMYFWEEVEETVKRRNQSFNPQRS